MHPIEIGPLEPVADGLLFPEGPVALKDGSLLIAEIAGGSIALIYPDRPIRRIHCGGGPNGAAFGPDGAVYVCNDGGLSFSTHDGVRSPTALALDNQGGFVQRIDLNSREVKTIVTHVNGARLGSLNDIVFDINGGCYIVDTGLGAIHYLDVRTRRVDTIERTLQFPNGMGLSPDGARLYVSETYSGKILRFDVTAPGRLSNRHEHYTADGNHGWDGLCIDGDENVCVANLAKSGISVIDVHGTLIGEAKTPHHDAFVTNICFGGPDHRTAYICASSRGVLYSVRWPWGGLSLNYEQ